MTNTYRDRCRKGQSSRSSTTGRLRGQGKVPVKTQEGLSSSSSSVPSSSRTTPLLHNRSSPSQCSSPIQAPSSIAATPDSDATSPRFIDGRKILTPGDTRHDFNITHGISDRIADIIRSNFNGPWTSWRVASVDQKREWWVSFQETYQWEPCHDRDIRRIFDHKGGKQLKNILDKLRRKVGKTDWIHPNILEKLNQIWVGPEWQTKSQIARKNRAVGSGVSSYTGGSISVAEHRKRFVCASYKLNLKFTFIYDFHNVNIFQDILMQIREHHREPTGMEIMERTKKLKDGNWICSKAKDIAETFEVRRPETQQSKGDHSVVRAENALFLQLVGGKGKKGNVWSQGDLGPLLINRSSPSTIQTPPLLENEEFVELQRRVANLTAEFALVKAERDEAIAACRAATNTANAAAAAAAAVAAATAAVAATQALASGRAFDISHPSSPRIEPHPMQPHRNQPSPSQPAFSEESDRNRDFMCDKEYPS